MARRKRAEETQKPIIFESVQDILDSEYVIQSTMTIPDWTKEQR